MGGSLRVAAEQRPEASLLEVVIGSQCIMDAKLVHDHEGGTIGETPVLIRVVSEHVPGFADLFLSENMVYCQSTIKQRVPELDCSLIFIVTLMGFQIIHNFSSFGQVET